MAEEGEVRTQQCRRPRARARKIVVVVVVVRGGSLPRSYMFLSQFFNYKRGARLISNEPRPRTFHLHEAGSYEALRGVLRPCASPLAAPRRIYKTRPSDQSLGGAGASASRPGTIAHFENRYCFPYMTRPIMMKMHIIIIAQYMTSCCH